MKRPLLLLAILAMFIYSHAESFYIGDIYYATYQYTESGSIKTGVEVTKQSTTLQGSITIPSSITSNGKTYTVTRIGEMAFNNCSKVTKVTLPSTLRTISQYAFTGSGITSIEIPASVTSIASRAFEAAKQLQSVTFSSNGKLTTLSDHAFKDCTALTTVNFGSNSSISTIADHAFYNTALTTVTLPANLETIGESAFDGCKKLALTKLPQYLNTIGKNAFYGCEAITAPTIPANVYQIDEGAFYGCTKFAPTFETTDVKVGKNAFYGCAYKTFTTPTLFEAAEGAFNCPDLTEVIVGSSRFATNGYTGRKTGESTLDKVFGSHVQKLKFIYSAAPGANWAQNYTALKTLELVNCEKIGDAAFKGCTNLTGEINTDRLTIGNDAFAGTAITYLTITSEGSIGEQAFANCKSLKEVTLNNTTVQTNAFLNCSNMTGLTLKMPSTSKSIKENAFYGCSGLKTTNLYNFSNSGVYASCAFTTCTGTVYIHSNTLQDYTVNKSPLSGSFFKEVYFNDDNKIVGSLLLSDMPYLYGVVFATTTTIKNPLVISCPALQSFYTYGNSNLNAHYGCVYNSDYSTLYCAPTGLQRIILHSNTKTIDCAGIGNAAYYAVIDATKLNTVPALINNSLVVSTILVKAGMKSKFLDYGEKHRFTTDYGATYSVYEAATYYEVAPDPIYDVNTDGNVNAADIVSIYNYIIDGEE